MNKARRNRLQKVYDELEALIYEEQEAFDNMPESIQDSDKGDHSDESIQFMEEAQSAVGQIIY